MTRLNFCEYTCPIPKELDGELCPAAAARKVREVGETMLKGAAELDGNDIVMNGDIVENMASDKEQGAVFCAMRVRHGLARADSRFSEVELQSELAERHRRAAA